MDENETLLGRAKARIEAAKNLPTPEEQVEDMYISEVKPQLDRIKQHFLETQLPKIFFPLIEEVKQFIESKDKVTMSTRETIYYFDHELLADNDKSLKNYRLRDFGINPDSKYGKGHLVRLNKDNKLSENIKTIGIRVGLIAVGGPGLLHMGFEYDNGSNYLRCIVGKDTVVGAFNKDEELQKFAENLLVQLEKREYCVLVGGMTEGDTAMS